MDEVFLVRKEVELMNARLKAIYFALIVLMFMGVFAIPGVIFLLWMKG